MPLLFDFSSKIFASLFQMKFGDLDDPLHPGTPKLVAAGIMVISSVAVAPMEVIPKDSDDYFNTRIDKGRCVDQVVDEKTCYPEGTTSTCGKSVPQSKQELRITNRDGRVGITACRVNEGSNDPGIRVRAIETPDDRDPPSQHQPPRGYRTHRSNLAEANYSPFPSRNVPFGHSSYTPANLENLGNHINNSVQNSLNSAFQHHRTRTGSQSPNQEGYLYYRGREYRVPRGGNVYARGGDIRIERPTRLEVDFVNRNVISINSGNIVTNNVVTTDSTGRVYIW